MNQLMTQAIILARTDYGEADRIITVLTPDAGKLRLMAKGVRRIKSKLAGGIELFSVSDLTYINGRGDIGTLISSRLTTHYGHIIEDIDRTMLGYNLIKRLHKITEDEPEQEYFGILHEVFISLNIPSISIDLIRLWFDAQMLRLAGHTLNLQTEPTGTKLQSGLLYDFSFDDMAFAHNQHGPYNADDIKFLRLVFANVSPVNLVSIQGVDDRVARTGRIFRIIENQA